LKISHEPVFGSEIFAREKIAIFTPRIWLKNAVLKVPFSHETIFDHFRNAREKM